MTLQIISQWLQAWASQVSIEFLSVMEKFTLGFALAPRFPVHSWMFLLRLGPGVPREVPSWLLFLLLLPRRDLQ